jgi:hypothetical protein
LAGMTDERSFDQLLDAWLDGGPGVAPVRVADAARLEVRTTRQMNSLEIWALRRIPVMNTTMRFAIGTAAVAVAALLGLNLLVPPNVGDDPAPSDASPSVSWVTFTSDRYAYAIQHPADWTVTEQSGEVSLDGMEVGDPGTDLIRSPDSRRRGVDDGVVVVSAHDLQGSESLADFTQRVSMSAACGGSGFALDDTQLDGEPAEQRIFECDVWDWLQVTAIHGGRGYVVWLVATAPPLAHERPINDQFLATFRFTD